MHTLNSAMKQSLQQLSLKNLSKTICNAITIAQDTIKIITQSLWWIIIPFFLCLIYVLSYLQIFAKMFEKGFVVPVLFYVISGIAAISGMFLLFYTIVAVRLVSNPSVSKFTKPLLSYTNRFGGYLFFSFIFSIIRLLIYVVPSPLQKVFSFIAIIFAFNIHWCFWFYLDDKEYGWSAITKAIRNWFVATLHFWPLAIILFFLVLLAIFPLIFALVVVGKTFEMLTVSPFFTNICFLIIVFFAYLIVESIYVHYYHFMKKSAQSLKIFR